MAQKSHPNRRYAETPLKAESTPNSLVIYDKLNSIATYFNTQLRPQFERYIESPPLDSKMREDERQRLLETVMQQVLLKLDKVDLGGGDEDARLLQKRVVGDVQDVLEKVGDRPRASSKPVYWPVPRRGFDRNSHNDGLTEGANNTVSTPAPARRLPLLEHKLGEPPKETPTRTATVIYIFSEYKVQFINFLISSHIVRQDTCSCDILCQKEREFRPEARTPQKHGFPCRLCRPWI